MSTVFIPFSTHQLPSSQRSANFARLALAVVLTCCAMLAGCGGGSSSSTTTTSNPVAITLTPINAPVTTSSTQQFTATVTNASNTAVTYQVNNVTGGSPTTGTINTSGLYTAPPTVPNPNTVEIEAISQQDTSKKATASVTITLPPPTTHIDISPSSATVPAGGQQTFTAAINGQPATVAWSVNCAAATPAGCGSITQAGVYTAPTSPPPGAAVSITAAVTNPNVNTPPANASITVQFGNGTLVGQYAFTLIGTGMAMAGTITANGSGSITAGNGDLNNQGAVSTFTVAATSTYTLFTDGRGNITLSTSAGTFTFAFAAVNHSHGFLTRFDSSTPAAAGTFDLQDSTKFTVAAFNGNSYAIGFSNHAGSFAAEVAGAGAFSVAGGAISGLLDVNSNGSPTLNTAITGTLVAPDPTSGRGTLSISSGKTFAYYVVDATHAKLVGLDASLASTGDLFQQTAASFTNASLHGSFAAVLSGFSSVNSGPLGEGAVFSLDGNGNVKNGAFDINQNGNIQTNSSVTGTYSVTDATTGRTTLSVTAGPATLQYAAYPQANGALTLLEIDSSNTAAGRAFPQQSNAFSNAALFGNFALGASGFELVTPAEEDLVGQWLPNGGTTFTGVLDVNDNGSVTRGTQNSLTGAYQLVPSLNGRAPGGSMQAGNFSSATVNFYAVDGNTVLFLEQDSNRVFTGIIQKQY